MNNANVQHNSTAEVHTEPGYEASITEFDDFMALQGEVFRSVKDRETHKVILDGESVFIKKHYGVGWSEILKSLLSFKWPILGARNEWQAIHRLNEIGIATTPLLAYGTRGCHPARKQSFVLTRDLGDIVTLEALCEQWEKQPPSVILKRKLIKAVAELACQFHGHGMWHRDFYLCHFALQQNDLEASNFRLHLMDLHRVEMHKHLPESKRLKDLAGLYFSAFHIGLTKRDILRFLKFYYQKPLRQILINNQFLQAVKSRAIQLDAKFVRKKQAGIAM
jgi:heptose I phosphotransferase